MKSSKALPLFLISLSVGTAACSSLNSKTSSERESKESDLAVAEICETTDLIHRFYRRDQSEPIAAMVTYNKEMRRDVGFFSIEKFGPAFIEAAKRGADCGPPEITARAGTTMTVVR